MESKKIAVLSTSFYEGGGLERVMVTLCKEIYKKGYEVDFLVMKKKGRLIKEIPSRINIINLNKSRTFFCFFPLLKYLKKNKPNILLTDSLHSGLTSVWAKKLSKSNVKIVSTVHVNNSFSLKQKGKIYSFFYKIVLKKGYPFIEKIIGVSEGVKNDLERNFNINKERIKTIYNPVDIEYIKRAAEKKINHPWLKEKTCPVVLGVGRLEKQKDFFSLIKSFSLIKREREVKLIILGEGKERKKLERLIKKLGLRKDVSLPGLVRNPYPYMLKSDVFVLSSVFEGLGMVIIESMACGTPVVSTDCPNGPKEILDKGYGKLVPVKDIYSLSEAIKETIEGNVDKEKLKRRALFFSKENSIESYINIFKQL